MGLLRGDGDQEGPSILVEEAASCLGSQFTILEVLHVLSPEGFVQFMRL